MPLNLAEADAVARVVRHLTGTPLEGHAAPTREQAIDALALLADAAHRKLGAGLTRTRAHQLLTEHWTAPAASAATDDEERDAAAAAEPPRVECCADEGLDCASCLTGRCSQCPECSRYEPWHEDDARMVGAEDAR